MSIENYTNVIIGSGEGGKFLAWHLASAGQKTAVVERRWIGGSCPNINCLPSKNEIWSAKVAQLAHHGGKFGVKADPGPSNLAAVRKRKREMVEGLIAAHLELYKASGAELILGSAQFAGPNTLQVSLNGGGTRTLVAERIFLNLGTHALIPPAPGLAESAPLTNIELLELDRLPEHLIVIGSGYVGLELAQAYRRFGSRVTMLEQSSQLLSKSDPDVAAEIEHIFAGEGIDLIAPAKIVGVHGRSGSGVTIELETPSGERQISGSDILIAAGRVPNTTGIGLESVGVELDQQGYIKVNDRLETTAANVWAIGESAGSPQFTHVSYDDFRVIRDNLAGRKRSTRGRLVPSCLFTDPPLAHVGLTESEARRQGLEVEVVKLPMAGVMRARTLGETVGFMKALVDLRDGRIHGFTMIGPEAGEVLATVQTAMLAGRPYTALRDAILTHPTMAEGLVFLFSSVKQAKSETETQRDSTADRDRQITAA